MRSLILCSVGLLALSSCATPPTTPQVTAVATDVSTLNADIQAATSGKPLTAAQAAIVVTDTAMLQSDVAALNAGSAGVSVASVLGHINTAISDIGPFVPEIEALVALAAPAPGAAIVPPTKIQADYARLQADAKLAK